MSKKNIMKLKYGLIFLLAIFTISCADDCKFNSIVTDTLPDGTNGTEYYYKLELDMSCSAPFRSFEITDGDIPKGMTLETSGELMGAPTEAGTFTFKIKARVCFGSSAYGYIDCTDKTKEFSLKIN